MRTLHSRLILLTALLSATQGMAADRHRVPPPVEMQEPARAQYLRILAALDAEGRLDDDKPALERVARILSGLVTAIPAARAEAGDWSWEAHVTSDARIDAFGMPGGKLIVGSRFVARLELDDAELATLIAHEMAHVIAGHRRPPPSDSMEMDVSERLRLAGIAFGQESEADAIGMELAHRAGWPSAGIVGFYEKLAAAQGQASFSATHPQAAARLARAREIVATFAREKFPR